MPDERFDIVIKSGFVIDGAGNPWFRADIGVKDGKIAEVGKVEGTRIKTIDAYRLFLCPGFMDIHSHSDYTLLVNPKAESKVRQGVTTEVVGNCGGSAAPSMGSQVDVTRRICEDYDIEPSWSSFSSYMDALERGKIAVNVAPLVGHGTVRRCVMGVEQRDPTPKELEEMKRLVGESMEAGAFGMSTGLVYPPGRYAKTSEIIELCKVVAKYGGIYASHIRGERETLVDAVKEAIEIGEEAGVPVEISHHPAKIGGWGKSVETLRLIDEARVKGVEVTCDMHSYIGGETSLSALLPPWVQEGGSKKILERVKDRELRKRIREDMIEEKIPGPGPCGLVKRGMWEKIMISSYPRREVVGKTIHEIAQDTGLNPFDAYFDLLFEADASGAIVGLYYNEEDIRRVLLHGCSMIGSDGYALVPYGVLGRGQKHPRSYGTFPMFIRKYVRGETRKDLRDDSGEKLVTLQEIVRKMTSLPTQKLGLRDRGLLREGMWADIVVFDLERIADKATYLQPYQYPDGIEYVLVNGVVVIENGEHTGALPGKPLKHHL